MEGLTDTLLKYMDKKSESSKLLQRKTKDFIKQDFKENQRKNASNTDSPLQGGKPKQHSLELGKVQIRERDIDNYIKDNRRHFRELAEEQGSSLGAYTQKLKEYMMQHKGEFQDYEHKGDVRQRNRGGMDSRNPLYEKAVAIHNSWWDDSWQKALEDSSSSRSTHEKAIAIHEKRWDQAFQAAVEVLRGKADPDGTNQRVNETQQEKRARVAGQRAVFLYEAASYTPETPKYADFHQQFINSYVSREVGMRGVRDLTYDDLNNSEKAQADIIIAEISSITGRGPSSVLLNQRACETPGEQATRMATERTRFWNALSQVSASERKSFTRQAMRDYILKEDIQRGIEAVSQLSMTDEQISTYAIVRHEAAIIYEGNTQSAEEYRNILAQEVAFQGALLELGLPRIDRASDAFSRFASEKYDDMVDRYCRSSESGRVIKLDNILIIRGKPRDTESPTTDPEFRLMLRLVSRDWEQWKKDNNITGDGSD
ncbi:MAG TPA: hypothetical protein VK553_06480 [Candidatus Nitrosopolaris rasttigaisensis]|nr:hypothetical protein [Candidatus Nitrosopolaris rasttigaisensis]